MSTPTAKATKSAKKSKVITLRLSPDLLARFPHDSPATKPAAAAPIKPDPSPSLPPPSSADKTSESNATPVPAAANEEGDGNTLAPPKVDGRRKRGGAGGVSGRKRAPPSIDPNAPPRERGRPGPKKKPRLPDGTIDHSADPKTKPTTTNGAPIPAHKLGPKANTGAINAGLRALDRSGKPCRRWERKGLQLKSFTGTFWNMPSWRAPEFAGDVKSDSTDGSSDVKESSAVASERSNGGGEGGGGDAMVVESSPALVVGAAA